MKCPKNSPSKSTEGFLQHQYEFERKLSEEELSAIQARFLANVSHELRTPLSVIKMYIEAIQDGMFESDDEAFAKLRDKFKEFEELMEQLIKEAKQ